MTLVTLTNGIIQNYNLLNKFRPKFDVKINQKYEFISWAITFVSLIFFFSFILLMPCKKQYSLHRHSLSLSVIFLDETHFFSCDSSSSASLPIRLYHASTISLRVTHNFWSFYEFWFICVFLHRKWQKWTPKH